MSVASWPIDLPPPVQDQVAEAFLDTRLPRSGEGPPRFERRFTGSLRRLQIRLVVNRIQKQVFDGFFETTLAGGVHPFWMPDPNMDGWNLVAPDGSSLIAPTGESLFASSFLLCMIGDSPPSDTRRGRSFIVSFAVTVLP